MWRTFGGGPGCGGGGGMGGGGVPSGGGRMLRSVQRAIRTRENGGTGGSYSSSSSNATTSNNSTTTKKPNNNNKSNNQFYLSSSSSSSVSLLNIPAGCVAATTPYWAPCTCVNCVGEFDWECVDDRVEDVRKIGAFDDDHHVFGEVPSAQEVEQAVCFLQQ